MMVRKCSDSLSKQEKQQNRDTRTQLKLEKALKPDAALADRIDVKMVRAQNRYRPLYSLLRLSFLS
jgi:hypothetical protein